MILGAGELDEMIRDGYHDKHLPTSQAGREPQLLPFAAGLKNGIFSCLYNRKVLFGQGATMLDQIRRSIASLVKFARISSVICSVAIPILVGVFVVYYHELIIINPLLFWLPLIFVIIISCLYAGLTIEMPLAAEYYIDLDQEKVKNNNLSFNIVYMSLLQEHLLAWNIMVRGYAEGRLTTPDQLKNAVKAICGQIVARREEYFAFERNELWNFAVYLWDEQTQELIPVWRDRHPQHPSKGDGRHWRDGEGHVGHAFRRRDALITPDAQVPAIRDLMAAGEKEQPYDAATYRSFVSQPISALGDTKPFGVLVATSNLPNRFDKANALVLVHASSVIASTIEVAYDSSSAG